MSNDQNSYTPTRLTGLPLRTIGDTISASPVQRIVDRWRRRSVDERRLLAASLRQLIEELEAANKARLGYEQSLIPLRNIEAFRAYEESKFLMRLDAEDQELILTLETSQNKLLLEKVESAIKLFDAQQELERRRNPPLPKDAPPHRDRKKDAIRDAAFGGGQYTRTARAVEEELIAKRGGRDHLTEEDREHIKNSYRMGAQFDEGQS